MLTHWVHHLEPCLTQSIVGDHLRHGRRHNLTSTALATLVLRVPRRLVLRGRPGRLPRLASLPSEDADEDSDMAEMAS